MRVDDRQRETIRKCWEKEVTDFIDNTITPTTKRLYKKRVKKFRQFCRWQNLASDGDEVINSIEYWVANLNREGASYQVVLGCPAAVCFWLKRAGLTSNLDSQRLRLMLRGLRRVAPATVKKHPVTVSYLTRVMQAAGILGTKEPRRFKAMAAVAFFGFFRPSELCMTDAEHYLRVKDARISDLNLLHCHLKLCSSKQSRRPALLNLYDFPEEEVKPVRLLRKYIKSLGQVGRRSPLFAITARQLGKMFVEITQEAQIRRKFTPYCFRHGGASCPMRKDGL